MIPSSLVPIFLLLATSATAIPSPGQALAARQDSSASSASSSSASSASSSSKPAETTPTPWVSLGPNGSPATTITPLVSTNSAGSKTTLNAKPTAPTPTNDRPEVNDDNDDDDDDDDDKDDHHDDNDGDIYTTCDSSKYEHAQTGNTVPFKPFCRPLNGSDWWVGGKYYVTWNPNYWERNSSVEVIMNYVHSGGAGRIAKSWKANNRKGLLAIEPSSDWLLNQTLLSTGRSIHLQNASLYFTIVDDSPSAPKNSQTGPTIILSEKPKPPPRVPKSRPPVSTLGLAVGLPLVILFVVGMVGGMHFCMKRERQLGPIAIGGGRRKHFASKRGYTGRKERLERMKANAAADGYRDDIDMPEHPPHASEPATTQTQTQSREWELSSVRGGAHAI